MMMMNNIRLESELTMVSEVTINYNPLVRPSERLKITGATDAEKIIRPFFGDRMNFIELFYIILLNRGNRVLGVTKISEGGLCGTLVDPVLVYAAAVKGLAKGIILVHNHPSGNCIPSEADKELTKKLKAGGKLLEISVLDHLILSDDRYYSFADEGMI